jgi:taurine dioxygenase
MIVTPFADATFGAEVGEIDLTRPIADTDFRALYQAFLDFHVLAIRDQDLSADQLVAFTRRFGPIGEHANKRYRHPDNPCVLLLTNEIGRDGKPIGVIDAGDMWHSDSSHHAVPAKMTLLHSVRRPSRGGDTEFCDMHAVYEALPEKLRRQIAGKFGVHHASKLLNPRAIISTSRPDAQENYEKSARERPHMRQPLVRTHPETGRPSVYASPRFTIAIDGMDDAEAQPILDALFSYLTDRKAPYHLRYKWQDGDVVLWDNRSVNHRAVGGYGMDDIRLLHRTTVAGDAAFYRPAA